MGGGQIATVKDLGDSEVLLDLNHPFAGQSLDFELVRGTIQNDSRVQAQNQITELNV
jgi:FKBP-type peptidyl-prolyl cis-trans isomerase 2